MTRPFLPYGRQCIDQDDVDAVVAALRSDFLTTGPLVPRFEAALCDVTGAPHAVACANGTAALHLAMLALDLGPRDAAIVPAVTFVATANAARFCGARVVFADVDPDTGLMTPDTLRTALAEAGRAARVALPVHMNGQPADMAALADVAGRAGVQLVEDACHALGTRGADGALVGACAHSAMACFSFHPVKAIATGEGGAVTTRDPALAERLAAFRNHGLERRPERWSDPAPAHDPDGAPDPWHYEQQVLGYNYRLSDVHAALGSSQLAKLPAFLERRRTLAALYDRLLEPLAPRVRPVARVPAASVGWHLYAVRVDFASAGLTRGRLMRALRDDGIGTQVHYVPVPRQPVHRASAEGRSFPGADRYFAGVLSLPLYVGMTEDDVAHVVERLRVRLSA